MISRTVYSSGNYITVADTLAFLIDSTGLFDSVTHETGGGTISCVNDGDEILKFIFSTTSMEIHFYNHSGTEIFTLSSWSPNNICLSTCNGVISVSAEQGAAIVFAFSFGLTRNNAVWFVRYATDTGIAGGCEYGAAYNTNLTNISATRLWTRIAPLCFPADGDGFEVSATAYGFMDKGMQCPNMNGSATGIMPPIFALEANTYMTDGAFCFRDA